LGGFYPFAGFYNSTAVFFRWCTPFRFFRVDIWFLPRPINRPCPRGLLIPLPADGSWISSLPLPGRPPVFLLRNWCVVFFFQGSEVSGLFRIRHLTSTLFGRWSSPNGPASYPNPFPRSCSFFPSMPVCSQCRLRRPWKTWRSPINSFSSYGGQRVSAIRALSHHCTVHEVFLRSFQVEEAPGASLPSADPV